MVVELGYPRANFDLSNMEFGRLKVGFNTQLIGTYSTGKILGKMSCKDSKNHGVGYFIPSERGDRYYLSVFGDNSPLSKIIARQLVIDKFALEVKVVSF